jgi:aldose sugar dehydrogenase
MKVILIVPGLDRIILKRKQEKQILMQPYYHSKKSLLLLSSSLFLAPFLVFSVIPHAYFPAYAAYVKATPAAGGPTVNDPNLRVEKVFEGLQIPSSIAFLGPNDILVLEKNKGTVDRIVNGKMLPEPLLKINNIGNEEVEWGMLGIAEDKKEENGTTYVFLYYTEEGSNGQMANHLYRYELVDNKLVNPKLLLELPATSPDPEGESNHDGGKVVIGPDNNVYTVIGDVGGHRGQAQNAKDGESLDGTSGVLRVTEDGQTVSPNPLGNDDPAKVYYAYGIRNSFGIDFDPVTGNMWDTENGSDDNDEINIVQPGFNSGWLNVQGMAPINFNPDKELVTYDGKGKYHDPQFVWKQTIGPTALKFLTSDKLGKQYENTFFTGDVNTGNLYNFKLNAARTGLLLDDALADKVADTHDELQPVIFGQGFGVITDIKVGSGDGFLYVLTYDGSIYRIVPNTTGDNSSPSG